MDLRGSIWTILSEAAEDAERLALDTRTPPHEVERILRFVNGSRKLLERLVGPSRRAGPAALSRSLEPLREQCTGALSPFLDPLDRAARRIEGLKKPSRTVELPRSRPALEVPDTIGEPDPVSSPST